VDGLISQINSQYLESLINYTNHLKARNAALRQFAERGITDTDLLSSYDRVLSKAGDFIYQTRKEFVGQMLPVLHKFYQFLSSGNEPAEISYKSDLESASTEQLFQQNLQRDILLQRTSAGVHRDDFTFQLSGYELKKYGSQGQQKSFLISLKLAEFEIIEKKKGFKPILLLDDIFDKLDDDRIHKLIELIAKETFGQIFITDARPDRTSEILRKANLKATLLSVENGRITNA
jgi:DNA replication and repair protein RecF